MTGGLYASLEQDDTFFHPDNVHQEDFLLYHGDGIYIWGIKSEVSFENFII